MSQPDPEPARVFEDRMYRGEWRVEWFDDDGGVEVAVFSGPKARERVSARRSPQLARRAAR
jgi:hypothetical protein